MSAQVDRTRLYGEYKIKLGEFNLQTRFESIDSDYPFKYFEDKGFAYASKPFEDLRPDDKIIRKPIDSIHYEEYRAIDYFKHSGRWPRKIAALRYPETSSRFPGVSLSKLLSSTTALIIPVTLAALFVSAIIYMYISRG